LGFLKAGAKTPCRPAISKLFLHDDLSPPLERMKVVEDMRRITQEIQGIGKLPANQLHGTT
jgi:hypothetical protein